VKVDQDQGTTEEEKEKSLSYLGHSRVRDMKYENVCAPLNPLQGNTKKQDQKRSYSVSKFD
jgi:hypothetical protein